MATTVSTTPTIEKYWRRLDSNWAFLRGFLANPREVASVLPSSRYLEQRIVKLAQPQSARCVVEFGAGTGGTTRALLAALPANATLLCVELNDDFVDLLRRSDDPRLIVHHGSAEEVVRVLRNHQLPSPDVVVSGIPFSAMTPHEGRRLVEQVYACLAPGGRFVAYQLQSRVREIGSRVFGPCRTEHEFRNLPPVRVYAWRKPRLRRAPPRRRRRVR